MFTTSFRLLPAILLVGSASAEFSLAPLFQSGAVLQRDKPVPVWGRADAGDTVKVSFAGQVKETKADPSGKWMLVLDPLETNAQGGRLVASAGETAEIVCNDVLVGEVWLASGQSNMQWAISQTRQKDQQMAAEGPVPMLRLFQAPRTLSHRRLETMDARWAHATPEAAKGFSAVGYFFGRKLAEELKVPVGIIHSSWGGSRIEPWWAEEGLEGIDELAALRKSRLQRSPGFPEYDKSLLAHIGNMRAWTDDAEAALEAGRPVPDQPKAPALLALGHNQQTGTYQAMIHPLVPYALRGFLWYQGESNNGEGMLYATKMRALIQGWRKQFQAPEAPFLYVQLAPFGYGADRAGGLPGIWKAQQAVLEIPHTGMAVINDIGNPKDIHPRNKSEVGRRLALWALADTYGQSGLVKSGPLVSDWKATHGSIAVRFEHVGGGLTTRDGKSPDSFEIAGSDDVFHPAEAKITGNGDAVILSSPEVPRPDRFRFAWSQTASPNLMNKEGLPAGAWHSHWPDDPTLGTKVSGGKPIVSSHPNTHNWNSGLTDGEWGAQAGTCYATNEAADFPKTVTIDLGKAHDLHAIRYGTPAIGSTKDVAVSLSTDGKEFTEVGRHEFPPKRAERTTVRFAPRPARYVRASFLDHHPKQDKYNEAFGFLSEVEAYAP